MQRSIALAALVLAGLAVSPALVLAQADPVATSEQETTALTERATMTERDDGYNWGWIGLLGLAGLLGLQRRDRETRENVRVRQPGQSA